ncbi:MAG: LppP/LprE family lipoprotein [Solirubrobacteraceae bacterium]
MVSTPGRRRWPARIAGLLGTAALLGTGGAIAVMVVPSASEETVVPVAPAATPTPDPAAEEPRKPKLTKAQRRARRAAVVTLTEQGHEPVRLADYVPRNDLRVLIGRPSDDDGGPRRAFFFAGREFIGTDSESPSARLRIVRSRNRSVTLAYAVFEGSERTSTVRVRFRWDGTALTPEGTIPDAFVRVPAT